MRVMSHSNAEEKIVDSSLLSDSVPRRASTLVKVVILVVGVIGISWLFSALKEREAVKVVDEEVLASYARFEPVIDGVQIYTLEGVSFIFESQSAEREGAAQATRVRLQLDGLKRGAAPIEVGRYRLGVYRGMCRALSPSEYEVFNMSGSAPLAFAECAHGDLVRQLSVSQEGRNLMVRARSNIDAGAFTSFAGILNIDITRIVE